MFHSDRSVVHRGSQCQLYMFRLRDLSHFLCLLSYLENSRKVTIPQDLGENNTINLTYRSEKKVFYPCRSIKLTCMRWDQRWCSWLWSDSQRSGKRPSVNTPCLPRTARIRPNSRTHSATNQTRQITLPCNHVP